MMKKIEFGTGGFRGVISESFCKDNIVLVAQALANIIKRRKSKKTVVIGYDYRFLSDRSAVWVSEVLAANKIETLISKEPTPTPAVMYLTKEMDNDFGVMITASHNPYYFNGIKVFQKEGMDADVTLTKEIEEEILKIRKVKSVRYYEESYSLYVDKISFLNTYLDYIQSFISKEINGSSLKILFDAFYGTGSITLNRLAKRYNFKNYNSIHDTHDTMFGNMLPNPTKANMLTLSKKVIKDGYDLALGIDSDGDRLGVLDEKGQYVDSNVIYACLYYYLVKYRGEKGDSVKNVATSNLIDKVAEAFNFKCHEVDVGFKNISSKIKEVDALIGGESSGGLTIRNYLFGKDSTFAAVLFIEMITMMKKPLSEIIKEVRDFASFHHVIVERSLSYHEDADIATYLFNKMPSFKEKVIEVKKIDKNVKYIFDNDSWVLLRMSGTEPVLRVFVEMESEEKVNACLEVLDEYIKNMEGVCA